MTLPQAAIDFVPGGTDRTLPAKLPSLPGTAERADELPSPPCWAHPQKTLRDTLVEWSGRGGRVPGSLGPDTLTAPPPPPPTEAM